MTENPSPAGHFVWHDLRSLDPAKAQAFYTQLIGWNTSQQESPDGNMTLFKVGEDMVADLFPTDPAQGPHSFWTSYLSVDDTDASVAKAQSLGGTLVAPAFDTPYGRIAVLQDPGGAYIHIVSGNEAPPAGTWPPAQGRFCWFELMVPDPDAVTPFYEQVFGWQRDAAVDMGTGMYYIFKRGEEQTAGMMAMPPGVPVPNWLPYIAVDNVDAATAHAVELGGTAMMGPTDVPNTGRFSVIVDPTGAAVALFTAAPMG
jgi:uncharacterized protein